MSTMTCSSVLSPAGAARMISAASSSVGLGAFTRLALVSGARRGELLEVRWSDLRWPAVDGDCGTLMIACRNMGKTATARRSVAIDPRTMDILAEWRDERRALATASGTAADVEGYVFSACPRDESAWRPAQVTRQVTALAAQTGVSTGVIGLRRYSMVRMSMLGVPADVVACRLGIAAPSSLLFWSLNAIKAADREAVLLLARELDQVGPGQIGEAPQDG